MGLHEARVVPYIEFLFRSSVLVLAGCLLVLQVAKKHDTSLKKAQVLLHIGFHFPTDHRDSRKPLIATTCCGSLLAGLK